MDGRSMKTGLLLTGSAVALMLMTQGSSAQIRPKIYGIGTESCQAGMQADAKRQAVVAWTTGYLTGVAAISVSHGTALQEKSAADVSTWLGRYCGANPTKSIEAAGAALAQELVVP